MGEEVFSIPIRETDAYGNNQIVIQIREQAGVHHAFMRRYQNFSPLPGMKEVELSQLAPTEDYCHYDDGLGSQRGQAAGLNFQLISAPAYAQTGSVERGTSLFSNNSSYDEVSAWLKSSDPFVRRRARRDLANLGAQSLPIVTKLLDENDYQLKLGGLVAVAELPAAVRASLPNELRITIARNLSNDDSTIRQAAEAAYRPPLLCIPRAQPEKATIFLATHVIKQLDQAERALDKAQQINSSQFPAFADLLTEDKTFNPMIFSGESNEKFIVVVASVSNGLAAFSLRPALEQALGVAVRPDHKDVLAKDLGLPEGKVKSCG